MNEVTNSSRTSTNIQGLQHRKEDVGSCVPVFNFLERGHYFAWELSRTPSLGHFWGMLRIFSWYSAGIRNRTYCYYAHPSGSFLRNFCCRKESWKGCWLWLISWKLSPTMMLTLRALMTTANRTTYFSFVIFISIGNHRYGRCRWPLLRSKIQLQPIWFEYFYSHQDTSNGGCAAEIPRLTTDAISSGEMLLPHIKRHTSPLMLSVAILLNNSAANEAAEAAWQATKAALSLPCHYAPQSYSVLSYFLIYSLSLHPNSPLQGMLTSTTKWNS